MNKLDIFKHLELTDSIENSFGRQVASDILKDTNLKGKKYYDAEDKITMIINKHLKNLSNGRCRNILDRYSEKTYRESYDDFIEHTDLVLYKVVVANETENAIEELELELTEDEYETVCNFVYNWWLDTEDYDVYNIAYQFLNCINDNKFTIDDITDNYNKVYRIFNENVF